MNGDTDRGFTQEETKAIIRAAVQGAESRWISEGEIETIYGKLWEMYVGGLMVEMVLKGEMLVSLAGDELVFKSKDGAA